MKVSYEVYKACDVVQVSARRTTTSLQYCCRFTSQAHFDLASQLQNMASKPRSPKEPTNRSIIHRAIIHAGRLTPFPTSNVENDLNLRQNTSAVTHIGDLSNTVIPTPIYEMWAERVATEFRNQVFLEKAEGLPVAPNMVVSPDDKKQLAQLQIGFISRHPDMHSNLCFISLNCFRQIL
eukprot:GHVQ01025447.1.p1 GENE.GHVQ01025447.1~~GHVQ01025447.1.p1  ORF type:complete len:179 (-),score=8.16 GHVQ01025447.1:415-951(-)